MTKKRAFSALIAAVVLVAAAGSARAQEAAPPAAPADAPRTPVIEPLPTNARPAALPSAPPPPVLPPAQPQTVHLRNDWLAVPGGILFVVSYGVAFLAGGFALLTPGPTPDGVSNDLTCDSTCKEQGFLAMIPVLGPLLSFEVGPHSATDTEIGLAWTGVEAVGLTMLIAGLIGHDVPVAPLESPAPGQVSFAPAVTPQGGTLSMRTAW